VTGRRGRRRRKLLDDLKERRGYSHLKEEALDRTMWTARLGRCFGPVVRQTTKWMNEWKPEITQSQASQLPAKKSNAKPHKYKSCVLTIYFLAGAFGAQNWTRFGLSEEWSTPCYGDVNGPLHKVIRSSIKSRNASYHAIQIIFSSL
jgi:hypothetical protein